MKVGSRKLWIAGKRQRRCCGGGGGGVALKGEKTDSKGKRVRLFLLWHAFHADKDTRIHRQGKKI